MTIIVLGAAAALIIWIKLEPTNGSTLLSYIAACVIGLTNLIVTQSIV